MPTNPVPQPWRSFFMDIDKSLTEELALHCLGGFVMTMVYALDRSTADVDVLPVSMNAAQSLISLAGQGSILHKRHGVYIQIVGVAAVPINYDERLTEMFQDLSITLGCLLSIRMTWRFRSLSVTRKGTETTLSISHEPSR